MMRTRVDLWERFARCAGGQSLQRWFDATTVDFRDLDWHMRGWWPFARQAVALDGRSFEVLHPHLRTDSLLSRMALEQILLLGTRAHVSWGRARPFIAELRCGKIKLPPTFDFRDVEAALTRPSDLVRRLLLQDPRALCWFGPAVQDCETSVRVAVHAARGGAAAALGGASARLRASVSFGTWAVRADARSFPYLSPTLRTRRDLLRLALEGGYGRALESASEDLRSDPMCLRLALLHAGSWQDLPWHVDPLLLLECAQEETRVLGEKLLRWLLHRHPKDVQMRLHALRIWPELLPLASRGQGARFLRQAMLADPDVALGIPAEEAGRLSCLEARAKACRADLLPRSLRRKLQEESGDADGSSRRVRRRLGGEMRCPVCLDEVCRPVMQCRQGHLICLGCLERLPRIAQGRTRCPVCRCEHEEQGFSRSLLADAILDELSPASPEEGGASL